MTNQDVISYWQVGSDDAFDTATTLLKTNKYHHALFFCHLALEKQLKARIVSDSKTNPPPIHNLLQLATHTSLKLSPEQKEQLREINSFNIEARYDDYKLRFYKKATVEYANNWYTITKDILIWLKKK